jgi:hypothetical protein
MTHHSTVALPGNPDMSHYIYRRCITCIMYQQLWGYKVEEKLYLGVREQKRLNTTGLEQRFPTFFHGGTPKIHYHIPRNPDL